MRRIGRFLALVLALILVSGVTVSCIRSLSSEGTLFTSIGSSFGGSGSSGGTSGGSSGGSTSSSTGSGSTPSTTGSGEDEQAPLPETYWDVGNQRYHLAGYTAYPAGSVNPNWFGDNLELFSNCTWNGNDALFSPKPGLRADTYFLRGVYHFGTESQNWHFPHETAVAISFVLDPSECTHVFGSVILSFSNSDQAYDGYYPLFKVEDQSFYPVDPNELEHFLLPDIADIWPTPEYFSIRDYFVEEGLSSEIRFLFVISASRMVVYLNDQLYATIVPSLSYLYYDLSDIMSALALTFDGETNETALFKSVCFYIK